MTLVRIVPALVALCALAAGPARSQTVRVGVHSVSMTHTEISQNYSAEGVGGAGSLTLRWRRLGLEVVGLKAALEPDSVDLDPYDVVQWDVRFSFWLAPIAAIEISRFSRQMDPEFTAPDVGAVRVGFVSEYPLARIASVRASGAYMVEPKFNGGGESGLAVEIGLGVAIGTSNGRFRLTAASNFERIDRDVRGMEAPIQVTQARLGLELGF